jgi:hypothetical protein
MSSARRPLTRNLVIAVVVAYTQLAGISVAQAEPPPQFYSNGKPLTSAHVPVTIRGSSTLHSTTAGAFTCRDVLSASVWNAAGRGVGEIEGVDTTCEPFFLPPTEPETAERHCLAGGCPVSDAAELPLEVEQRQASACTDPTKTELSQCPALSERSTITVPLDVKRRGSSLPWKLELTRGVREEENGVLAKVGLSEFGEPGTAEGQTTKCYPKETVGTEVRPAVFGKVPAGCLVINLVVTPLFEFVYYGTQEIWLVNGAGNGLDASHLEFLRAGALFSSGGGEGQAELTGRLRIAGAEAQELITAR